MTKKAFNNNSGIEYNRKNFWKLVDHYKLRNYFNVMKDYSASFYANVKTTKEGQTIISPMATEFIKKIENAPFKFSVSKVGKSRNNIEFLFNKSQSVKWQMYKYTIQI